MKLSRRLWVMLLPLGILAFGLAGYDAAPASAGEPAQDTQCYTLTLEIVGGKGDLPDVTPANCAGGQYRAGTMVELTARPAEGFEVYAWHGTDDDGLTTLTNTVTMDRPQVVGVHYANLSEPIRIVTPADGPGGVALGPEYPEGDESVIGTDTRVRISSNIQYIPYRWIAKLEITFPSSSGGCTGWFAGPHTVMTAGHCVYNSAYGGWATSITVIPAKNGSTEPYGRQTTSNVQSNTGWTVSGLDTHDYGVVILPNDNLGNLTGWFRWKTYAAGTLLGDSATITGYPGDKTYGTMWSDSDPVTQDSSRIISYEVDTYSGESGSPVYQLESGYFWSYGIHTKGTASPACKSGDNCGTRMISEISNFMINNWGASTQIYLGCDPLTKPYLSSPMNGGFTSGSSLYLDWGAVSGNGGYEVEVWHGGTRVRSFSTGTNVSYAYVYGLSSGVYAWRVRAKNGDKFPNGVTACPPSEWSSWANFAYSTSIPNVKINEVQTGSPDAIELYNAGSTTAFVGGWKVTFYGDGSTYTIPYYYSIAPYSYLVLLETSGTNTSTRIHMNTPLGYSDFEANGAILIQAGSTWVDFVRFGTSTQSYPAGQWSGTNPTTAYKANLGRSPNGYDTNNGANWCRQRASLYVSNGGCLPTAPTGTNLVYNYNFYFGESGWAFFGGVIHQVSSGYLLAYHTTASGVGGFYQYRHYYLPSGAPMEVSMDIGNTSNFYKVVTVLLRDPNWTSSRACYFTIPAKSPVRTYTMRVDLPTAYAGMVVQTYIQPSDGKPTLWFDNINVQYKPWMAATTTPQCIVPIAPANVNLMANGNFSEANAAWRFGVNMVHQYLNGLMYMFRTVGSTFGSANMFQVQLYQLPVGAPLELTMQLGNTSSVNKTAVAIVHSPDWSDTYTCYFTVPHNSSLHTYTLRGKTTSAWSRVIFALYIQQADGQASLAVDNIDLRWKPSLSVFGTVCIDPTPEMVLEAEATEPAATDEPTPFAPLFGPDDTFELVEAEADIMAREGEWTVYDTDAASGTGYIFSSGSADDILTLPFYGDGVEVVYVKHPALGTFAVEIDGEVVATVNASAVSTTFGAREIITGLAESEHMLRILPVEGTVAIDALTVEGYFTTSSSLR